MFKKYSNDKRRISTLLGFSGLAHGRADFDVFTGREVVSEVPYVPASTS